jgi:hypothetical protein
MTLSMLMTGEPGTAASDLVEEALDSAAESLAARADEFDAAQEARRKQYLGEAWEKFRGKVAEEHQETMRKVSGNADLVFEVDPEGIRSDHQLWEQDRLLTNELPGVFQGIPYTERVEAFAGVSRMTVRFSESAAEWGPKRDGDALTLTIPADPDYESFHAALPSPMLEHLHVEEVGFRCVEVRAAIGWIQDMLRQEHGIQALCDVDWYRFTAGANPLENAWSLYLLSLQGVLPLGAALKNLLADREDLVEAAGKSLERVMVAHAATPEDRALEVEEGELRYRIYVAETHEDYWSEEDLAGRLADQLSLLGG